MSLLEVFSRVKNSARVGCMARVTSDPWLPFSPFFAPMVPFDGYGFSVTKHNLAATLNHPCTLWVNDGALYDRLYRLEQNG